MKQQLFLLNKGSAKYSKKVAISYFLIKLLENIKKYPLFFVRENFTQGQKQTNKFEPKNLLLSVISLQILRLFCYFLTKNFCFSQTENEGKIQKMRLLPVEIHPIFQGSLILIFLYGFYKYFSEGPKKLESIILKQIFEYRHPVANEIENALKIKIDSNWGRGKSDQTAKTIIKKSVIAEIFKILINKPNRRFFEEAVHLLKEDIKLAKLKSILNIEKFENLRQTALDSQHVRKEEYKYIRIQAFTEIFEKLFHFARNKHKNLCNLMTLNKAEDRVSVTNQKKFFLAPLPIEIQNDILEMSLTAEQDGIEIFGFEYAEENTVLSNYFGRLIRQTPLIDFYLAEANEHAYDNTRFR